MSLAAGIDVAEVNQQLAGATASERIRWAVKNFGAGAVLLSSMQKTASVLMNMFSTLGLDNEVLFVDTGYHFLETLRFRDEVIRRYKLHVVTLYPEMTPEQQEKRHGSKLYLYVDGQPECCRLRKEDPFVFHMKSAKRQLVINGTRRAEGGKRSKHVILTQDPRFNGFELHPLLDWSDSDVDGYLTEHQVMVHPLHSQNYPSIGCECCTTPVEPGEDPRAGRWRHLKDQGKTGPLYCGINFTDGSGI